MNDKNNIFKADEEQPAKNKQARIVIVLGVAILLFAIILTVVLITTILSVSKKDVETTRYELTTGNGIETTTEEIDLGEFLSVDNNAEEPATNEAEASAEGTTEGIVKDTTKNALVESYEQLSVNGENLLSDHYENEFIQLVEKEYGVDSDLLVAIYSVPDSGTNFVLQFNGEKRKGEYVKSPDTLEKVYQIDADRNIKVATGKATGNEGVSYAESVMCVAMIKTIVMEQYPNYFTGLDG